MTSINQTKSSINHPYNHGTMLATLFMIKRMINDRHADQIDDITYANKTQEEHHAHHNIHDKMRESIAHSNYDDGDEFKR